MPHLIVIFLVALIVFGPEKLPELARTFGKAMAEFKRATGDLRAGFEEHMRDLERETRIREAQKQPAQTPNTIMPPTQSAPPLPESIGASNSPSIEPELTSAVTEKPTDGHS